MNLQALRSLESRDDAHTGRSTLEDGLILRPDERWICVHTAPHKEFFAALNLAQQGYRSFVPKVTKTVRHARQTREVSVAFFPRYLFVILASTTQPWRPICGTFGVNSLIMEAGRPKSVPSNIVEALMLATNESGSVDFREDVAVGQSVRMLTGPFADLVGTLMRVDGQGRVAVFLNIMGGERLITTKKAALQPTNSPPTN